MKKKDFKQLEAVWYDKLKASGFHDQEAFKSKDKVYEFSPYLNSKISMLPSQYAKRLAKIATPAYESFRNYLMHGPFYPNLHIKYQKERYNGGFTGLFSDFLDSQDIYWNEVESLSWQFYCDGATYRGISKELRRLYRLKKLSTPTRSLKKGMPFSLYYIQKLIPKLKQASADFNRTDPNGYFVLQEEREELLGYLPESNKPLGELE